MRSAAEQHEVAVVEDRESVGGDHLCDLAPHQVVRHQEVRAIAPAVVHVQHVLAVGCRDDLLEHHAVDVDVEGPGPGGGEVVAAREDDPVAAGQDPNRRAGGVDPLTGSRAAREHIRARRLGVEGNGDQQHVAGGRRAHRHVGQRLVGVGDRFVDLGARVAGARVDAQLQPAVAEADEHLVEHRHRRMRPRALVFARGGGPLDVMGVGEGVVAVAASVREHDGVSRGDRPTQHLDVVGAIADAEDRQELVAGDAQVDEAGLAVKAVQLVERLAERRFGEEVARVVGGERMELGMVAAVLGDVQGEDVLGRDRPEFEVGVVSDDQHVADAGDVARPAGERRGDPARARQTELGGAERLDARGVDRSGTVGELAQLTSEPASQQLVVAAGERSLSGLARCRRVAHDAIVNRSLATITPGPRRRRRSHRTRVDRERRARRPGAPGAAPRRRSRRRSPGRAARRTPRR